MIHEVEHGLHVPVGHPLQVEQGVRVLVAAQHILENGLQALRITLCACSCSSSQAMVMSKNSLSSLMSLKAELIFLSKSFQRRQNFSEDIVQQSFHKDYFHQLEVAQANIYM